MSSIQALSPSPSPTDISISSSSFDENISAGTAVATLSTTDPDSGDTFTYSLVSGTGDTDNSAFTISGNQIKINASPDYETKNSYCIRVRTTDVEGLIYEESLNLSVNDIDESTETAITNSTIIANSQAIFNTSVNGESFNYYIHPGGDITGVGFNNLGSPINQQTVDSSAYESYIVSLFDQIDAVIDLDFTRQSNNDGTTIDIYAVADDGTNKVGTTYFWNSSFDIDFEITGNNQFNQNILVHELGHALGLDHPFENGFDARYTVDDTVMSYNIGSSGWTTYFTEADLSVLKNIWGVENDVVNTGGGGGGGGVSPTPTPAANPTPSTEFPTQGSTSPAIPVITTQQPSLNSPVLGIQSQAAVSSIKLDTPLVVGTLQLTQAVVGTVGSDVITGSDASEVLAGGQGKDKISGGAGADGFLFEQPGEFGKKNRDTITDFNPDEGDKVIISRNAFDEVKKIKLKVVTGKKKAKNADTEKSTFIYDDKKGLLYFNENLKEEGWGDGGVFARLKGAPELGVSDFTLV